MQQKQSTGKEWFCNCFDWEATTVSHRDCPFPHSPVLPLLLKINLYLMAELPGVHSPSNNVLLAFRKCNNDSRSPFYCTILSHFLMMWHVHLICAKNTPWHCNTWAFHIDCRSNYLIFSINVSIKGHSYMELHTAKVLNKYSLRWRTKDIQTLHNIVRKEGECFLKVTKSLAANQNMEREQEWEAKKSR